MPEEFRTPRRRSLAFVIIALVALSNPDNRIKLILLDIEGTTTPIDFVYKTLFPYARAHTGDFIRANLSGRKMSEDVVSLVQEHARDLAAGHNPPAIPAEPQSDPKALVEYVYWLMDQDRKSTPLKSIQGKIWEEGYNRGALKSEVFADVPRAFQRWTSQGREICIYSSGSVLAQKLLFANTHGGNLTEFISAYFDTNTGPKKEAASYSRIANEVGRSPGDILFLSDVTSELAAAKQAELKTLLCSRPGNQPQPGSHEYDVVETFDHIFPS